MHVNREQFMEQGYLILPGVIPSDQLDNVRQAVEVMVTRRQEISRQQRTPDQPPGGWWEASAQPRLSFDRDVVDASSGSVLDCLTNENTLGVCRQLVDADEMALHNLNCMCSAVSKDTGPADWHRDIGPGDPAPLRGMIANMVAHGPSYLQWNIALYDDSVLWVVPGSHLRVNTKEENNQLSKNSKIPLPGAIPVVLKAGEGVVYTHLLLHWGSNYTRKLRRAIHPGYRPFGFPSIPNVHWRHWEPGFYHYLTPETRTLFESWDTLFLKELERFARVFHAMINRDPEAFYTEFGIVHPSPQEKLVSLVMLSKLAGKLYRLKTTPTPPGHLWGNSRDMTYFGSLFTVEQAETLRDRFQGLEEQLTFPEARRTPGFQGFQSQYNPDDLPVGFSVTDFVASWQAS